MLFLPLTSLSSALEAPLDLLLCSASFEIRCRSVPESLDLHRIKSACLCHNENLLPYVNDNLELLQKRFSANASELHFDTDNPLKTADELWRAFSKTFQGPPKRVLIDVSTFTHEGLLICLRAIKNVVRPSDVVQFTYVPAKEYSIGDEDEDKWLSKGIREIRSVIGYPGEILPSRRIHLIVLVGFETERARAVVDAYEPSLISLGYGTEGASTSKKNFAANELFHKRMMALFPKSRSFTFTPNDHAKTAASVQNEVALNPGHNVVIAPLNTKLSTIGTGLAAFQNDAVQLCYAQAEFYNFENYSLPADSVNLFSISGIGSK